MTYYSLTWTPCGRLASAVLLPLHEALADRDRREDRRQRLADEDPDDAAAAAPEVAPAEPRTVAVRLADGSPLADATRARIVELALAGGAHGFAIADRDTVRFTAPAAEPAAVGTPLQTPLGPLDGGVVRADAEHAREVSALWLAHLEDATEAGAYVRARQALLQSEDAEVGMEMEEEEEEEVDECEEEEEQ